MVLNAGNILLVGAVLLFVSIIAGKAGHKFGVPVLLLFLGVGMLFGSDGLGIQFNSPTAAQFIGMVALSVILFSGGMDTKFSRIRPVLGPGIVLATAGVMLTTFLTGGAIYLIAQYIFPQFSLTLYESLLLAAVMSSTDSASVFSILRSKGLKLKENLRPMLEFESGSNDPMANILTILFIQVIQVGGMSFGHSVTTLLTACPAVYQSIEQRQHVVLLGIAVGVRLFCLFVHRSDQREWLFGRIYCRIGCGKQQNAAPSQHRLLFRDHCLALAAGHVPCSRTFGQSQRAVAGYVDRFDDRCGHDIDLPTGYGVSVSGPFSENQQSGEILCLVGRFARCRTDYLCDLSVDRRNR